MLFKQRSLAIKSHFRLATLMHNNRSILLAKKEKNMFPGEATHDEAQPTSPFKTALKKPGQEQIVILTTLLLLVLFSIFLDGFATMDNLITLARNVSVLGILGVGMALVVIARGLDLSQVAVMAVSTAWALKLMNSGASTGGAVLLGWGLVVLIGALNGFLIAFVEMPALFVTLASGILVYGAGRTWLLGNEMILYVPKNADLLLFFGQGTVGGIPVPILLFALVALLAHIFLSRTSYGRFIYAHGDNAETARFTGIAVRPLTILEYTLCAFIGYTAGLVMVASVASIDLRVINSTLIFDSILVVVLGGISLVGGRGGILSVIAGTALIGTLLNGMTILNLQNDIQDIIKGVVLLGAILLDNRLHPREEETARQGDI